MRGGLQLRRFNIGDRIIGWFRDCVDPDTGVVSWDRKPLFRIEVEDEIAKSALHISGVRGVPPPGVGEIRFSTHNFMNPFIDYTACFQLMNTETKTYLKDRFGQRDGPNEHTLDKKGGGCFEKAVS